MTPNDQQLPVWISDQSLLLLTDRFLSDEPIILLMSHALYLCDYVTFTWSRAKSAWLGSVVTIFSRTTVRFRSCYNYLFRRGMSGDQTFTRTCVCGRIFTVLGAFTRHEKGCGTGRKRLSEALTRAREVFRAKRARYSRRAASPSQVSEHFDSNQLSNACSTGSLEDPSSFASDQVSKPSFAHSVR